MKIYVLRHTDTIEWEKWIILWSIWWNLSESWISKANYIWKFLKESKFWVKRIFTSDLKRTIDTWNIINKYLNKETNQLQILRERSAWKQEWKSQDNIDWGIYEKKSLIHRKHIWGESFLDVKKRAIAFLSNLDKNNDSCLVISHSVMILMLISIIKNLTIKESLKINIKDKLICIDFESNNIDFTNLT